MAVKHAGSDPFPYANADTEATSAEFQGEAEDDLAEVLEQLSKYF